MARVRPPAPVSDWMVAVAEALPHPHRQPAPYTLGEAISELGAFADSVTTPAWKASRAVKGNRDSLHAEVDAQSKALGPRLRSHVGNTLAAAQGATNRASVVKACADFDDVWRSEAGITAAFDDLCAEAKNPGTPTPRLRQLAEFLASQLGEEAISHFSPLRDAADMLISPEQELTEWKGLSVPQPFDEPARERLAREKLAVSPVGRVVVWSTYARATAWGMRTDLGPVTVLRPEWVLPNAFDDDGQEFPERSELRDIHNNVHWLDELHQLSTDPDHRFALVRVDLGERKAAGATEAARRLIHALLAIPVTAGGVSWQETGAAAVILDGTVRTQSLGPIKTAPRIIEDDYGVGATGEILHEVEADLGPALLKRPMPDHLVEALSSLREARMTEHRDVQFYGARRVSPRNATALEDHAMELIASVLKVRGEELAEAVEQHYALQRMESRALGMLLSPFARGWATEPHKRRDELEAEIARYTRGGVQVVDVAKVVASVGDIRALPMTALQRTDFEEGILTCTDPAYEKRVLSRAAKDVALLRARHRRVRNAVNHGLPLASSTLGSVREYAETTSQYGLDLALTWFIDGTTGPALVAQEKKRWTDRVARVDQGISWAQAEASV